MPASIASTVASVIDPTGSSIGVTAYDGSKAGPPDAKVTVHIRSVDALRHAVTAPGSLGLARAFITGAIDLDGDPYEFLQLVSEAKMVAISWPERLSVLRELGPTVLRPLPPPPEEAPSRLRLGLRHARRRDAAAISHHYDVSNRFYEMVLGPTMAYTCAVYPKQDSTLEEAQIEKVDLVCRKLGLKPGMRLLDVGCGWGTMVRHAAREYGVTALGVTLSKEQASWAAEAIDREGLSGRAEVRFADYRDVRESNFDAVSSIGLTEHIGKAKFPAYVRHLAGALKPEGRLLNHCITRPDGKEASIHKRGFIARYAFPDGELLSPGYIVSGLHDNGLEVRHEENFREHYAMTLRDWCANLERNWDACVAEAGLGRAKVWALYMAGSRLGFDENRIQLHQVLAVKTTGGRSGMPLRQDW